MVPLTGMLTVSLIFPFPVVVFPLAPPVTVEVYVTLVSVAGNVSVTVAPVTSLGPAFVAVIV